MKRSLLVFFTAALFSVFLFSFGRADTEYRCEGEIENECGIGIESRSSYESCTTDETCTTYEDKDGNEVKECYETEDCETLWTDWNVSEEGSPYKVCTQAELQCSGQCYPAPQAKDAKDTTLLPQNVFEDPAKDGQGADTDKLKLPVNLGWNDVNEALQTNPSPSGQCTVESYRYEIAGDTRLVPSPSSAPVLNEVAGDCKLSPSANYQWRVQACGDIQGTDCGEWSQNQSFATSSAPELKSPFDPDWEQKEHAGTPFPANLKWCPHQAGTRSFAVNIYEISDSQQGKQGAELLLLTGSLATKTSYSDSPAKGGLGQLRKNLPYGWEVAACTDVNSMVCGILSQFWTLVPQGELITPGLLNPSAGAVVNALDSLEWQTMSYETHYVVRVDGKDFFIANNELPLSRVWSNLRFYTTTTWQVAPCGGSPSSQDIENCKKEDGSIPWSEQRQFVTTGAAPTGLGIKQAGRDSATGKAAIPLLLNWDDMGGAASYYYEVATDAGFSNIVIPATERVLEYSEVSPGSPNIKSDTNYWVRVKTCADEQGKVCGDWSQISITTAALTPPPITAPQPDDKEFYSTTAFSWNPVFSGNFYRYNITYLSRANNETSPDCSPGTQIAEDTIPGGAVQLRLRCLGQYQLQIQSCVDQTCQDASDFGIQKFQVETFIGPIGGLVPCDRANDNPATPWNERSACGVQHIFLLLRNIIDFLLWKFSLIIVTLMAIATGAILFFSFGGTEAIVKVKTAWRAIGIGVLVFLFAWFFLNLLLGLVGFNIGLFGNWHEVKL